MTNKVSSNGYLNAWYAFSNDASTPRKVPQIVADSVDEVQINKEIITRIKNNRPESDKTTGIIVKSMGDDCLNILNDALSDYSYEVIEQYSLSKAYLIKFDSISCADEAIDILNARVDIKYAKPNYIISIN